MTSGRIAIAEGGAMTVPEACAFLRISRSQLYRMMDEGELGYAKIGGSRRLFKNEVVRFLSQCSRSGKLSDGSREQ